MRGSIPFCADTLVSGAQLIAKTTLSESENFNEILRDCTLDGSPLDVYSDLPNQVALSAQ